VNYTLDEEQVERFILNSSKGLADVTNAKTKSVQFIHESVRDFLLKDGGLKTLSTNLGRNFEGESHDRLKACCVEYINMNNIQELIENLTSESATEDPIIPVGQEYPFLEYVTYNILYHANAAAARGLVQEDFLRQFSLPRWVTLHNRVERFKARHYKSNVSLLYVLAENNMASLIPIHSSSSSQTCLDIEEDRFGTPLFAARATKSNEAALALMRSVAEAQPLVPKLGDICEMFLQHMMLNTSWTRKFRFSRKMSLSSQALANSDSIIALFILSSSQTEDENETVINGRVLLRWAIDQGNEPVVKILLSNGAKIEMKDGIGRTPLSCAAISNNEAAIKILLTNGAEIETKDNIGQTPLILAAFYGNEAVVRILLANGAETETKDYSGRTPLGLAAFYGNKAVAQILLTNGAKTETKDDDGRTPLSRAVISRNEAVVQILLINGAEIETKDNKGRTPLSWAALYGYEAVVRILLANGAETETKDYSGRTPLGLAAFYGNEAVVQILLANGAES
jgi:ankyrin repeat protein